MRNKRQRIAISQAEIARKSKGWGAVCEGYRVYQKGTVRHDNPYKTGPERVTWFVGWDMAHDDEQWRRENE